MSITSVLDSMKIDNLNIKFFSYAALNVSLTKYWYFWTRRLKSIALTQSVNSAEVTSVAGRSFENHLSFIILKSHGT